MMNDCTMRWYVAASLAVTGRLAGLWEDKDARGDRGDVPGWVMITVMTAALVVAILVPFRTAITSAVSNALAQVTGAAGS